MSAFLGAPPLAIPGSIIGGIGGILYYQNVTGDWASWAYVWTLIIGFVGVGMLLSSLLARRVRREAWAGVRLMVVSLVLFGVFAAFFTGWGQLEIVGPLFLMLLGVWILLRGRLGKGRF
jgi:peptidoglycan/LPS O-acetylase OafA/YrhL